MGRHRRSEHYLPKRVYKKGRCYWYAAPDRWINLGPDIDKMFDEYARLEGLSTQHAAPTFGALSAEYRARTMPKLAPRTQKDYTKYLDGNKRILHTFGHMRLQDIKPAYVTKFHALESERLGNVQANRAKACISLIWNWGRRVGLTDLPNPCLGVTRAFEGGRGVYVDDVIYHKVWVAADWDTRDCMDLAWLLGQRPADVFSLTWEKNVQSGTVLVRQAKTQKIASSTRVEITGDLAVLLCDLALRHGVGGLLAPISASAFDNRFEEARNKAGVPLDLFQLRDLRAKAGTEKTDQEGIRAAQALLGHATEKTTETYVRKRLGQRVKPVR
jgi:integrase